MWQHNVSNRDLNPFLIKHSRTKCIFWYVKWTLRTNHVCVWQTECSQQFLWFIIQVKNGPATKKMSQKDEITQLSVISLMASISYEAGLFRL